MGTGCVNRNQAPADLVAVAPFTPAVATLTNTPTAAMVANAATTCRGSLAGAVQFPLGRLALVAQLPMAPKLTTLCPAGTVTPMHASRTSLKLGPSQRSWGRPNWVLSLRALTWQAPLSLPALLQGLVAPTRHVQLPLLAGLAPLRSSNFVRLPK